MRLRFEHDRCHACMRLASLGDGAHVLPCATMRWLCLLHSPMLLQAADLPCTRHASICRLAAHASLASLSSYPGGLQEVTLVRQLAESRQRLQDLRTQREDQVRFCSSNCAMNRLMSVRGACRTMVMRLADMAWSASEQAHHMCRHVCRATVGLGKHDS